MAKVLTKNGKHKMGKPLFSFIHIPDAHLSENLDVVSPFIESVNAERFHPRPDFVVFGGDNIEGNRQDGAVCEQEMPLLKNRLERLQVPYDIICHNHDTWGEAVRGVQYQRYFKDRLNYTRKLPHGFAAIFMSGEYVENGRLIHSVIDNVPWLDRTLNELRDRKVILFSHMSMFPPRKPIPPAPAETKRRKWQAFSYSLQPDESAPARKVIAKHGNVIVHYSGHCHVHSVARSEGTYYVTTGSIVSQPWEYRYMEVHQDRIEHRCILSHNIRAYPEFWNDCLDEDHPNVNIYNDGLPRERDFTIYF